MTGTNNKVVESFPYPIPKSVRVGPFALNVVTLDEEQMVKTITEINGLSAADSASVADRSLFGFLSMKSGCIFLDENQMHGVVADTLLHEILHAVWAVAGGWSYTEADEERIVSTITGTLLDTLKRNKELVRFLLDD